MPIDQIVLEKDEAKVALDAILKTSTTGDPLNNTWLVDRLEHFLNFPSFSMCDPGGNKSLGVYKTVAMDMDVPANDEFMIGFEISDPDSSQVLGEILFSQEQALELCGKLIELIKDPCASTAALEIAKKHRANVSKAEQAAGIE